MKQPQDGAAEPTPPERASKAMYDLIHLIERGDGISFKSAHTLVIREYRKHMIEFAHDLGLAAKSDYQAESMRFLESQLLIQQRKYMN